MNVYGFIKEASITDYIDSDALYQVLKDCPVTSHLELVDCYDDMTIKMKGDMGFQFFKVVKGPEGLEAYKIAENSGEKLGDTFPLTNDLEEYDNFPDNTKINGELTVGDKFTNKYGTIIEIIEPTEEGTPQYNIVPKVGARDCRGTSNYDSLRRILQVNGYERFTETEEPETREEIEKEINQIRKDLDYCERRDAVCCTFGSEQQRAELEGRLIELSEKLDRLELEECSAKDDLQETSVFDHKVGSTVYWVGAGNEISATGKIIDFPTDGRMTIKWDDGDVNTYDIDHPDIQNEYTYDNSINGDDEMFEGARYLKEESYEDELFLAIEDALYNAGFSVTRYSDAGMMTNNLGWCVSNSDGEVQLQCMGTYLSEANAVSYLTEAPNPDNAEANELIKSALKDAMFAINNTDKLKEIGIDVEVKKWHEDEPATERNLHSVYLVGPKGRKLSCNTSGWRDGFNSSSDMTNTTKDWSTNHEENTIEQRNYKQSRLEVSQAKQELPVLKKRLKLYERRYGKDSSQYRELVKYIKKTEETIANGIKARQISSYRSTPNENVDFKNYLDKEKVADRPKPYVAPKMNPTVAAYKGAKAEEDYEAREEERNKKYDEEDAQRIADMAKRAAEEKSRRDAYLNAAKERTQATLKEIRDRIAASKAKRGAE